MIISLKFLLKDFTSLRTPVTNFCIKFAFPRYKLQSCIKIFKFFVLPSMDGINLPINKNFLVVFSVISGFC